MTKSEKDQVHEKSKKENCPKGQNGEPAEGDSPKSNNAIVFRGEDQAAEKRRPVKV
jgi:hypothetical protein